MKKFIQIALASGHVYEIPTDVVVQHRTTEMLARHPQKYADLEASKAATLEAFEEPELIKNWAANCMTWSDLQRDARLVRFTPPVEDAWHAGDWSYHDNQALVGDLDGDAIMSQPVELILNTMALTQQLCNVTVLNGPDGQPYGAFAMVFGNPPVIDIYVSAMQHVTAQIIAAQHQGTQPAPQATH